MKFMKSWKNYVMIYYQINETMKPCMSRGSMAQIYQPMLLGLSRYPDVKRFLVIKNHKFQKTIISIISNGKKILNLDNS